MKTNAKEKLNLHEGHRARMMNKLVNSIGFLPEHELLEILLYFALPRIDTNELSHKLLRQFGSLSNLFLATEKELCLIKGIGKKTAELIVIFGKIYNYLLETERNKKQVYWKDLGSSKKFFQEYFNGMAEEQIVVILLDKNYKKIMELVFKDKIKDRVSASIPEIANAIALHKPNMLVMGHNHPSGSASPSQNDDFATLRVAMLCKMYGVVLLEHMIVARDKTFSYRFDGRLTKLSSSSKVSKLFFEIMEGKNQDVVNEFFKKEWTEALLKDMGSIYDE